MLFILECDGMGAVDLLGGGLEGRNLAPLLPSFRQWIAACARNFPQPLGLLACLCERDERDASETDVAALARNDRAKHPALRSSGRKNQVKATTVCDSSNASARLGRLDALRR